MVCVGCGITKKDALLHCCQWPGLNLFKWKNKRNLGRKMSQKHNKMGSTTAITMNSEIKVAYSRIVLTNFQLDPPCGVRQYCRRHPPPLAVGVALDFACFAICER